MKYWTWFYWSCLWDVSLPLLLGLESGGKRLLFFYWDNTSRSNYCPILLTDFTLNINARITLWPKTMSLLLNCTTRTLGRQCWASCRALNLCIWTPVRMVPSKFGIRITRTCYSTWSTSMVCSWNVCGSLNINKSFLPSTFCQSHTIFASCGPQMTTWNVFWPFVPSSSILNAICSFQSGTCCRRI